MSAQDDQIKRTESVVSDVQKPGDTEAAEMDVERRKTIEKSLVRKLDLRCSLFILLYIMSEFPGNVSRDRGAGPLTYCQDYLDRNNISAARLKGLQSDLNMTDTEYSTCLSIVCHAGVQKPEGC